MSPRRALLTCVLLISLVSPAAILAQDARIEFPAAVVALRGSFEPSTEGEGCELIWPRTGTPTLRVASSSGDRFRQDLREGEIMTIPDLDGEVSCVFRVDISVAGGRSFTISVEGSELVQVSDDDLEALESTMVLPVELDRSDDVVLATDDFLDLDLDQLPETATETDIDTEEDATPSAGSTDHAVPGVLRKVPVTLEEPSGTPTIPVVILEGPGATPEAGEEPDTDPGTQGGPVTDGGFQIVGQLDFWSDEIVMTDLGCAGGPGNEDIFPGAQVIVRDEVGAIIGYGELQDTERSGEGRCSYDFSMVVEVSGFVVIELGDRGSVVYSATELEDAGWRIHLETGER